MACLVLSVELKFPTIKLLLSISFLRSVSNCFINVGAPVLGAFTLTVVRENRAKNESDHVKPSGSCV